jgi:hypothetical protein
MLRKGVGKYGKGVERARRGMGRVWGVVEGLGRVCERTGIGIGLGMDARGREEVGAMRGPGIWPVSHRSTTRSDNFKIEIHV